MTRLFGSDGIKGIANKDLTAELAFKLGQALVSFLLENLDERNFGIMLALMTGMRLGEI